LRAYFGTKRHELCVTTYQMCILLLFNTQNTLSFKDIHTATAIPIPDLKRSLAGLTSPKCKILIKEPNTKFVEETDTFTFNDKFRSKLVKVKVPAAAQKETDKERNVTKERVEEDRKILYVRDNLRMKKRNKIEEKENRKKSICLSSIDAFIFCCLLYQNRCSYRSHHESTQIHGTQ